MVPQSLPPPADNKGVKCPNCSNVIPDGVNKCACGYDHVDATTGRPRMEEIAVLPDSPLAGRGLNFNMGLGLVLCLGAAAMVWGAYHGTLGTFSHPYAVAAAIFAMGVLRYGRGCAQCRSA
jgi:hypothetical protein